MKHPLAVLGAWLNLLLISIWIVVGTLWAGEFVMLFLPLLATGVGFILFADWVWARSNKKDDK